VEKGPIDGAVNIPLDELRSRLDEIPQDTTVAVSCHVGLRSYIATRILSQHGKNVRNITGGYKLYQTLKADKLL